MKICDSFTFIIIITAVIAFPADGTVFAFLGEDSPLVHCLVSGAWWSNHGMSKVTKTGRKSWGSR